MKKIMSFLYFSNILYLGRQRFVFLKDPSRTPVGALPPNIGTFLFLDWRLPRTGRVRHLCPVLCLNAMTLSSRPGTGAPCACAQPAALDDRDPAGRRVLARPPRTAFLRGTQKRQPGWLSIASTELRWEFSHKFSSLCGSKLDLK